MTTFYYRNFVEQVEHQQIHNLVLQNHSLLLLHRLHLTLFLYFLEFFFCFDQWICWLQIDFIFKSNFMLFCSLHVLNYQQESCIYHVKNFLTLMICLCYETDFAKAQNFSTLKIVLTFYFYNPPNLCFTYVQTTALIIHILSVPKVSLSLSFSFWSLQNDH